MCGSVSGGCVESDVYENAREVMETGEPKLLSYGIKDEEAWEVGLPCGGEIDVFVERARGVSGGERPLEALRRLVNGFRISQAIHVAATLGIADLLADGPRGVDDLAAETDSDERSLYRLLRALAGVGVFREETGRRFSSTSLSDLLRRDASETLYGWAAFAGRPLVWQPWGDLLHSVRTGENAFRHLHGTDIWEYRAQDPVERAMFDRAMTDVTRGVNRSLLAAYDFGRFSTVVDVGGGRGALLTAVLEAHPGCAASCSTGRRSSTALPTSSIQVSPSDSRSSAGASSNRCPTEATPTSSRRSSTTGRTLRRSAS